MSSMQLRNRMIAGGAGARKALTTVDENVLRTKASKVSSLHTSKLGTRAGGSKSEKANENHAVRAALGDLSNKLSVNVGFFLFIHIKLSSLKTQPR